MRSPYAFAVHRGLRWCFWYNIRMNFDNLMAVSPIDGRYANKCSELQEVFSEYGLVKRRVLVECTWLKALAADKGIKECKLTAAQAKAVDRVAAEFSLADAQRVKDIEKTTNHDVKAVEYFLKEKLSSAFGAKGAKTLEFVHSSRPPLTLASRKNSRNSRKRMLNKRTRGVVR